ncbi:Alkaline phosphatase [Sergentomyia squamirostris]
MKLSLGLLLLSVVLVNSASLPGKQSRGTTEFRDSDDRRQHPRLPDDGIHGTQSVTNQEETIEYWTEIAKSFVSDQIKRTQNKNKAKNVIFFLGDGLGITTITAARNLLGGEQAKFSFEKFPHTGSSMTYCVDKQVADSACTATAYLTGVKGNYATTGVNGKVPRYDCEAGIDPATFTTSLATLAQRLGKSTGLVTTTRVTHASPSGLYTHIADRDWEDDNEIRADGCDPSKIDDIAKQLVEKDPGRNFNVIMGGGKRHFLANTAVDEEGSRGRRTDGRNLIEDWLNDPSHPNKEYVWNREQLLALNVTSTDYVLGLFETTHLLYNLEAKALGREDTEPTLSEMTEKALEIMKKNENGFFLFVEGGKIDLAHHDNYLRASLDETVEFHKAIEMARSMFKEEDTLVVVTADHSHAISMSGYPNRKHDIFGYVGNASDSKPYFTMGYANGPGYGTHVVSGVGRVDPRSFDRSAWNFEFPVMAPRDSETHGGEDVPVYASGPWAHLFTGTYEQHVIPHLIAYAADYQVLAVNAASLSKHEYCTENPFDPVCDERRQHPRMPEDGEKVPEDDLNVEHTQEWWTEIAKSFISDQIKRTPNTNKIKNVIYFLGDGMGISTVTASRMMLGGEEMKLSFEKFPHTGSSMTYCLNRPVADSASTSTAYLTGVKANYGTVGVNGKVARYHCTNGLDPENQTTSLAKLAQMQGKSTGFITNTRVTHASPAGLFGHSSSRGFEDDEEIRSRGCDPELMDDLTEQLVHGDVGSNFNVILGGGRRTFRDYDVRDEENSRGTRRDGRDLIQEWLADPVREKKSYVWNREGLLDIDPENTDHLLGLFEATHMLYHLQAIATNRTHTEPTLSDMTRKALEIVRKNPNGFFLFVEGGRIDLAHHSNRARAAFDETVEFSKAIEMARNMFPEEDTLIVVTADHSHVNSFSGYPTRKNDIIGFAGNATDGKPYFTINYGNGPHYDDHVVAGVGRVDFTNRDTSAWNFGSPSLAPMDTETHGGEDVPVYASGPWAHLFTGTYEQNVIPHLIAFAADYTADGWLSKADVGL